jgi:sterol desaturase/sphingolipid hydroxylase (fatty acid hydroxylase superfamily)
LSQGVATFLSHGNSFVSVRQSLWETLTLYFTPMESLVFLISTPFYTIVIVAEILLTWLNEKSVSSFRGTLENIYLSLCNAGVDLLSRGVAIGILVYFYNYRVITPNQGVFYWVALIIGLDFMFYWLHLLDHRIRFFWAIHVTHHSSDEFNFTVGFRSSVFQPLYRFVYFIPLALCGFRPHDIYFIYAASQIYGIILHTSWTGKMGWLDWILVTPSHHRVHHGSNPEYIDKNMGMVLIIWDRLFGTFEPEVNKVRYGITKSLNQRNAFSIIFHEWKSMISDVKQSPGFNSKLKNIFGPPEECLSNKKQSSTENILKQ